MYKLKKNLLFFNKFLKQISFKTEYVQKLNNKIYLLNLIKKKYYKEINKNLYQNKKNNFIILYTLEIFFSNSNTYMYIYNLLGNLKFFCSAGRFFYKGKNKKARILILTNIIFILIKKLKFIKKNLILRLKNTRTKQNWIIKKLKNKNFVKTIICLNLYSHNGCKKKKFK